MLSCAMAQGLACSAATRSRSARSAARDGRSSILALEQLDGHAFGPADEADAHAWPRRGRLLGELDALGLEVGGDRIDTTDRKPEMVETLVGRGRRRIDAVTGRDRGDEDVGAADLEVDARLALLHGADHLGA